MHVLHGLVVFPYVAHDAIEIARLPDRALGMSGPVDGERRRDFDGIHKARQRVTLARDDERVPVVRHEHVTREKKSPAGANAHDVLAQASKSVAISCVRTDSKLQVMKKVFPVTGERRRRDMPSV